MFRPGREAINQPRRVQACRIFNFAISVEGVQARSCTLILRAYQVQQDVMLLPVVPSVAEYNIGRVP